MRSILLVEDYPDIQKIYQTVLDQAGYNVTAVNDGEEALKVVADKQPDLILLDLLMAKVGGLEFLRRYNAPAHPDTKVIVLSNLASPELSQEAKALGANKYLTKSKVTPNELVAVVKQTLAAAA